jgi:hypothetical protein
METLPFEIGETARRVLEQIRENVSRAAATNRASNE